MSLKTKRRTTRVLGALVAMVMLTASQTADADPPPFEGGMKFGAILGPADPEEYSWTVQLGDEQFLREIDDQTAAVEYAGHSGAFTIKAEAAHDATGATVPTSLSVSDRDVITLTVHHRAGNPSSGGTPFRYPILGGYGWNGGLTTTIVQFEPVREAPPAPTCHVPRLKGRSLLEAQRLLRASSCALGNVHRRRNVGTGAKGPIVKQGPQPGSELPAGASVWVTLGSDRGGPKLLHEDR